MSLQCSIKAQRLKADAIGPNVPAMRGKRVVANHHRLHCVLGTFSLQLSGQAIRMACKD